MKPEVIMPRRRTPLALRAVGLISWVFIFFVLVVGVGGCAITELDETVEEAIEQCEEIAARERIAALEQCADLLDDQVDALIEWSDARVAGILEALGCVENPVESGTWDCSGICERTP